MHEINAFIPMTNRCNSDREFKCDFMVDTPTGDVYCAKFDVRLDVSDDDNIYKCEACENEYPSILEE